MFRGRSKISYKNSKNHEVEWILSTIIALKTKYSKTLTKIMSFINEFSYKTSQIIMIDLNLGKLSTLYCSVMTLFSLKKEKKILVSKHSISETSDTTFRDGISLNLTPLCSMTREEFFGTKPNLNVIQTTISDIYYIQYFSAKN